jgi:hypothetical protein
LIPGTTAATSAERLHLLALVRADLRELGLDFGEKRLGETFELRRAGPDSVADVELHNGLVGDELDHVVGAQDSVVAHQGVGHQLHLVEGVAVLAGDHAKSVTK